jgi:hypothetical protein
MACRGHSTHTTVTVLSAPVLLLFALTCPMSLDAQSRGGADGPGAPATATPRAGAPIDLTGYWVSVITQDWRWRMVTPAKGDYGSVPITLEAKKVGDAWDPAKDEAAGERCKAYGAPAIMAAPTRLHLTWQDGNTLKVETDTGTQTRLFHFGEWKPGIKTPSWQGDSVAVWQTGRGERGAASTGGSLRVVTTNVRAGYLRKNGVPYSENAVLTEYWDLASEPNGDRWITITSMVEDPKYLRVPYVTALQFKKESDGAKWEPTPCSAR